MKKIFTLIVSLGALTAVFAQSGHQKYDRESAYEADPARTTVPGRTNKDTRFKDNTYRLREKEEQIGQINREFDAKVNAVMYNRRLRSFEKNKQIRRLEKERAIAIRKVNDRFDDSRYTYNPHREKDNYDWKH